MNLIFAGTPDFARVALKHLHAAGHTVSLVLTQPDRPAGRGLKLQASAVKAFAQSHGMALCQPRSLKRDGKYPDDATLAQQAIAAAVQGGAQLMVVAAYGLLLPQWVLDATPLGCLNIHGSLLPRWRGAAPIHRAIEAGDAQSGVTIMQMDAGLDTGAMLAIQRLTLSPHETTASLHDRLAELGAIMVVQSLATLPLLQPQPQPSEGITYAHKIDKAEAAIDWRWPAEVIERKVRAFNPFPIMSFGIESGGEVKSEERIKVWAAHIAPLDSTSPVAPGTVVRVDTQGIGVAAGDALTHCVVLTELQRAGGKRLSAAEFLRGYGIEPGWHLKG